MMNWKSHYWLFIIRGIVWLSIDISSWAFTAGTKALFFWSEIVFVCSASSVDELEALALFGVEVKPRKCRPAPAHQLFLKAARRRLSFINQIQLEWRLRVILIIGLNQILWQIEQLTSWLVPPVPLYFALEPLNQFFYFPSFATNLSRGSIFLFSLWLGLWWGRRCC